MMKHHKNNRDFLFVNTDILRWSEFIGIKSAVSPSYAAVHPNPCIYGAHEEAKDSMEIWLSLRL